MIQKEQIEHLLNLIYNLTKTYESLQRKVRSPQEVRTEGSFEYVPFSAKFLYQNLKVIEKLMENKGKTTSKPLFIDYGCGIGATLAIAKMFGYDCRGIEINKDYIRDWVCYDPYCQITEGDLTNKEIYEKFHYDLVYYYCPFTNHTKELAFEIEALSTVKIGGFVIAPSPGYLMRMFDGGRPREDEMSLYKASRDFKQLDFKHCIFQRIR